MREELIRVLKAKLGDVNQKIDSLVELNRKIEDEKDKLDYASNVLSEFRDGDEYNILNFDKLTKEDFERILNIVDNDSNKLFDTNECSYEGLIYLIDGIKNGVSLNLTEEQRTGIEYLVRGVAEKEEEYGAIIDGLTLAKLRYGEEDVEALNQEKSTYINIVNDFNDKKYVKEIDKVCDAIDYNGLDSYEIVAMLTYILSYNAEVYELRKNNGQPVIDVESYASKENEDETKKEVKKVQTRDSIVFKPIDIESYRNTKKVQEDKEDKEENEEISFTYEDEKKEEESEKESHEEVEDTTTLETNEEHETPTYDEIPVDSFETPVVNPFENNVENKEVSFEDTVTDYNEYGLKEDFEKEQESIQEEPVSFEEPVSTVEELEENNNQEEIHEDIPPVEEIKVDNDFQDVITESEDYEEEKTSNRELQRLFSEYDLKDVEINDTLLNGNADNYRVTLDTLKKNELLEEVSRNKELLTEVLSSSSSTEVESVLNIVREDLSVDEEDYRITLKIVLNTLPSVFVKEGGNFDTFVKNVSFFKEIGINLINLFDFSKEVFIVDNDRIVNNYNIVKKYDVEVDYKNAKYMLVLPNIAEKMDFYIESVYEDKTKNEIFDGIKYINNYAVKLNSVTDLTIKRLRYSSENGKRVFGSKPNSLAGEITNLKVNALNIDESYLNNFFDNHFEDITSDEVREFARLVGNSSNVGNYSDELEMLEKYHKGLRYVIGNVNISYNKVVRYYNILRSYGINNLKALHFAVCYNLVITKDEYQELKKTILELGGNA